MAQQVEKPLSEEIAERRERAAQIEERERAQFASTFERAQQGQMMADSYMRDVDDKMSAQERAARASVDNLSAYNGRVAPMPAPIPVPGDPASGNPSVQHVAEPVITEDGKDITPLPEPLPPASNDQQEFER